MKTTHCYLLLTSKDDVRPQCVDRQMLQYAVLYGRAMPVAAPSDLQAVWDSRFPPGTHLNMHCHHPKTSFYRRAPRFRPRG